MKKKYKKIIKRNRYCKKKIRHLFKYIGKVKNQIELQHKVNFWIYLNLPTHIPSKLKKRTR